MFCPKCGKENKDGVHFCKYCGTALTASNEQRAPTPVVTQEKSIDNEKRKNYVIIGLVALIVIVLLIACLAAAGVFNNNSDNNNNDNVIVNNQTELKIIGGSMSTASSLDAKTYAHINVGKEHAGETIKITTIWSRNGNNLNSGHMITCTVDGNGYVDFNSADAFKYYPDQAIIKLYNSDGSVADQLTVSLSPSAGTQTF